MTNEIWSIHFNNANSRETYFTIHNVHDAHRISTGKGVRIGILDWLFGCRKHPKLYSDAVNFTGNDSTLNENDEHGYWMTCVLKEIAPECDIVALNVFEHSDKRTDVTRLMDAIRWSMDNEIDVLTYSSSPIPEEYRGEFDAVVDQAVDRGIVTTFIHYDNENNLWPYGMFPFRRETREPDVNILHYDYNTLFIDQYKKWIETETPPDSGNDIPYFSFSSTSPVTAGFVAILKSIDGSLTPRECKDILIQTSYSRHFRGIASFENGMCSRVADIGKAARHTVERRNKG